MAMEGAHMTVIDTGRWPVRVPVYRGDGEVVLRPRRTASTRPADGVMVYRGTGVRVSRAPHRPRPVSVTMTVILAVVAALIAAWLVALAQSRSAASSGTSVPEQLAVVQVQPGENLQRLAARVAPDAPVGSVIERIKQLNELDSAALDAGQTLIAPIG